MQTLDNIALTGLIVEKIEKLARPENPDSQDGEMAALYEEKGGSQIGDKWLSWSGIFSQ